MSAFYVCIIFVRIIFWLTASPGQRDPASPFTNLSRYKSQCFFSVVGYVSAFYTLTYTKSINRGTVDHQEYMDLIKMYVCMKGFPIYLSNISKVSRLYSLIQGARLVDSSKCHVVLPREFVLTLIDGQWAIPCDTITPISFTFGSVIPLAKSFYAHLYH